MTRTQNDDELQEIKNNFYVGNYQQCINEARKLKLQANSEAATQRDIYIYWSYIAQNKFLIVMEEISDKSSDELKPLKWLAQYLSGKMKKNDVVSCLEQTIASGISNNVTLALVAAMIYILEDNIEAAYRALHICTCLETLAFMINILLRWDRIDVARKKLLEMQTIDDDATLTQLAHSWINLAEGGDKLQDAYYIYQELCEKYANTPLLINGKVTALIGQKKYQEIESLQLDTLLAEASTADSIINSMVLSNLKGDSEDVRHYITQLKDIDPNHSFLRDYEKKNEEFLSLAQTYKFKQI